MRTSHSAVIVAAAAAFLIASGCSSRADDAIGESVESSALEAEEAVTSCNADGCWTAEAQHPVGRSTFTTSYNVHGGATFTGPDGSRRRMGVCLLQQYAPVTPCVTDA